MNHLNEGMIHAWLDGALDAAQSAETDAHVKACAECSAKVAEARGLIAASSRILVSLDDTPANVIPKKAPVAPTRRWRATPWVSGLAAAAILVVLWRTSDVERPTPASDIVVPDVRVVTGLPEPSLERLKEPAPPPARPTAPVVAEQRQARVANRPQAAIGRVSGAGAAAGVASDLASAQAAASPSPAAPAALRDESLEGCYRMAPLDEIAVTSANVQSRAPERARRASAPTAATSAAAPSAQKAAEDARPAMLLRLDSASVVRTLMSDSVGSWTVQGADSARVFMGGQSRLLAKSSKVRCP